MRTRMRPIFLRMKLPAMNALAAGRRPRRPPTCEPDPAMNALGDVLGDHAPVDKAGGGAGGLGGDAWNGSRAERMRRTGQL